LLTAEPLRFGGSCLLDTASRYASDIAIPFAGAASHFRET
jgi:hypothetical protein